MKYFGLSETPTALTDEIYPDFIAILREQEIPLSFIVMLFLKDFWKFN